MYSQESAMDVYLLPGSSQYIFEENQKRVVASEEIVCIYCVNFDVI